MKIIRRHATDVVVSIIFVLAMIAPYVRAQNPTEEFHRETPSGAAIYEMLEQTNVTLTNGCPAGTVETFSGGDSRVEDFKCFRVADPAHFMRLADAYWRSTGVLDGTYIGWEELPGADVNDDGYGVGAGLNFDDGYAAILMVWANGYGIILGSSSSY